MSRRTIWRPALTIQSFIRICGRPLVWFAMANEFCRLGQLDISYSEGSATRNPVNAPRYSRLPATVLSSRPFVLHCGARTTTIYIYIYIYIYIFIFRYIDIFIWRVTSTSCDHRLVRRPGTLRRELFH